MFGAVDLGSNSFRLHIGRHDGETIRVVKSARDPIRLAAGLDKKGNLSEAAIASAIQSLKGLNGILSAYPLDAVRAVATNTLRVAGNTHTFLAEAEKALGYPIEVISGEEEGRLIYLGMANSFVSPAEKRLVADIGGGSTELILGRGQEIEHVESFSVGTVRQSLSFFPDGCISASAFDAAILSARCYFEDAASFYHPKNWKRAYASSGTMRAISELIARSGLGPADMTLKSLEALKSRFIQFGDVASIDMPGLKPERAASVVGGLAILIALFQELGITVMTPVETGLRMGVMWDLYLRANQRDRRDRSVREFQQKFHCDQARATRVAEDASAIYSGIKASSESYAKLLYWAALLHEAGLAVSQTNYHKHGAYLAENADLPGFTAREQRILSRLVLGQKGNLKKVGDLLADADLRKAVLALRIATTFLHAHIGLDFSQFRLKAKSKFEMEVKRDWLAQHPTLSYSLNKEQGCWRDAGVDFSVKQV